MRLRHRLMFWTARNVGLLRGGLFDSMRHYACKRRREAAIAAR